MVACGSPAKREGGSSAWALVGKGYVDLKLFLFLFLFLNQRIYIPLGVRPVAARRWGGGCLVCT